MRRNSPENLGEKGADLIRDLRKWTGERKKRTCGISARRLNRHAERRGWYRDAESPVVRKRRDVGEWSAIHRRRRGISKGNANASDCRSPSARRWTMEGQWSDFPLVANRTTFPEGDRRDRRKSVLSSGSGLEGASGRNDPPPKPETRERNDLDRTPGKLPRQKNNRKIEAKMERANRGGDPIAVARGKRSSVFQFPTFIFRGSWGNPPCSRRSCGRDAFGSDFPEPLPAANPSLHLPGIRPLPSNAGKETIKGPEILSTSGPMRGKH